MSRLATTKFITVHCDSCYANICFLPFFINFASNMEYNDIHIEQLKSEVLARFGRTLDSPTDYDALSLSITESVGEQISVSTLKRLYGYDRRTTTPRPSTLSALARYAGYAGWSDFVEKREGAKIERHTHTTSTNKRRHRHGIALILIITAIAIIIAIYLAPSRAPKASDTPPTPPVDPVEQLREKWTTLTVTKCDSIRSLRNSHSPEQYIKLVEEFYYAYTFETLRHGIHADINQLNISDPTERSSTETEIFTHCQEISVSLIREYYRRNDGPTTATE